MMAINLKDLPPEFREILEKLKKDAMTPKLMYEELIKKYTPFGLSSDWYIQMMNIQINEWNRHNPNGFKIKNNKKECDNNEVG